MKKIISAFKKVYSDLKALLKANYKKSSFWVSAISLFFVASLLVAKFKFGISISAADIAIIVSSIGVLIVFVGNLISNSTITQIGESLDSTKISTATQDIIDTITALESEVNKLKATATDTNSTVSTVADTTTAIADTVGATTTEDTEDESTSDASTITTSIGSVLDTDGNIVGVASSNDSTTTSTTASTSTTTSTTSK